VLPFCIAYDLVKYDNANSASLRLLDKIAKDIMVCENKTVRKWPGTIGEYKNHLRKKMLSAGAV